MKGARYGLEDAGGAVDVVEGRREVVPALLPPRVLVRHPARVHRVDVDVVARVVGRHGAGHHIQRRLAIAHTTRHTTHTTH